LERSKIDSTGLPSVNSYASLEDLLRSDAHLVIVNTPVVHFEYAKKKKCVGGKHAIVEKPLPLRCKAEELVALATEKN
jgi:predicted dehydrogenase